MNKIKNMRYLIMVMLAAFVANAVFPFIMASYAPTVVTTALNASAAGEQKILLCTAEGIKLVDIDTLVKFKQERPGQGYKCPLCYVVAHSLTYTTPVNIVDAHYLTKERALRYRFFAHHTILKTHHDNSRFTRAPPLSAII